MDETAVSVRGGKHYLYRAVDKRGKSVGSLLSRTRGREAARAFFQHAVVAAASGWPSKVNVDGYAATHLALRQLGRDDDRWRSVTVRSNRYLNNIVEQDHRAIKRRCAAMLGLKSFETAEITVAGIELAHRIRKEQFSLADSVHGALKRRWDLALTPGHGDSRPASPSPMPSVVIAPELKRHRPEATALTEARISEIAPRRCARKISDGRGLYLLVAPNGGRYWRYNYRYQKKSRTLALGVYPDVSLQKARARHHEARSLLADGCDPSTRKGELISKTQWVSIAARPSFD